MDSKNNFVDSFINFINICDEGYLIDAANKGLYKRAIKDIDKGVTADVSIENDKVVCNLSDGTVCELKDDITSYKCICPSRSVCKHVLMSIMYIQQNMKEIFKDESIFNENTLKSNNEDEVIDKESIDFHNEQNSKNIQEVNNIDSEEDTLKSREVLKDYSWVSDYSIDDLKKFLTEKQFNDIIFRFNFGRDYTIEEKEMLTVEFNDTSIRVRFLHKDDISKSLCSCKSKEICEHRIEAIIAYKLNKNTLDLDDLNKSINIKISKQTIDEVKALLHDITMIGLSKLPKNIMERIEHTAVLCHTNDLPKLEKLMRTLKSNLELYFSKNAAFSRDILRRVMTKIYLTALALEGENSNLIKTELVGEHKTSFVEIPSTELAGVGGTFWRASSGYEGVTYYFFDEKRKEWFTYTNMNPNYYGKAGNRTGMYKSRCPWDINASMNDLCKARIKFYNCKINKNFRISSSSETKGDVITKTNINEIDFGNKMFNNWSNLIGDIKDEFHYSILDKKENYNLVLLKVSNYGKSNFDNVTQRLNLPIYDINDEELNVVIRFTRENSYLIRAIERLEKRRKLGSVLLGKIYKNSNDYEIEPISMYYEDGTIVNLTLD